MDLQDALNYIETGQYMKSTIKYEELEQKIQDFCNWLNATTNKALFNLSHDNLTILRYSLQILWSNISNTITIIDQLSRKRDGVEKLKSVENNETIPSNELKIDENSNEKFSEHQKIVKEIVPEDSTSNNPYNSEKIIKNCFYYTESSPTIPEPIFRFSFNQKITCLLCNQTFPYEEDELENIVENHSKNKQHIDNLSDENCLIFVRNYHKFWRGLNPSEQTHQLYFPPQKTNQFQCTICLEIIPNNSIAQHINECSHKINIQTISDGKQTLSNTQIIEKKDIGKCLFRIPADKDDLAKILSSQYNNNRQFLCVKDTTIYCNCCEMNVEKNAVAIKMHLESDMHLSAGGLERGYYYYLCYYCKFGTTKKYLWEDHLKITSRHYSENYYEYECFTCQLIIFGDDSSKLEHVKYLKTINRKKKQKIRVKRNVSVELPDEWIKNFNTKPKIMNEILSLLNEAKSIENNRITKDCCEYLLEIFRITFPNCQLFPFGSRAIGLNLNTSDLDLFIDINNNYDGFKTSPEKEKLYMKLCEEMLHKYPQKFSGIIVIKNARVPIIKFRCEKFHLQCDLSFKNGLGVEKTKFINYCMDLQPILEPFILIIKKWSKLCGLDKRLHNYALMMMAIFYLQQSSYLPSVEKLKKFAKIIKIDGYQVIDFESIETGSYDKYPYDLLRLLTDFFKYYAEFKYASMKISVLWGCPILQSEINAKNTRIHLDNKDEMLVKWPMCLQDPFVIESNITRSIKPQTLNQIIKFCNLTYKSLNEIE